MWYERGSVSTTSSGLVATAAAPDTNGDTLDGVLTAEGASVGRVLGHFDLLDLLSQAGTITGTVLTSNADLLSSLSLFVSNTHNW
jgi:hypothetical protein